MRRRTVLSIIAVCVIAAGGAFADQIIYVDGAAHGANDGTSWENAYTYLQDALADAGNAEKPVEIRVAQGIYRPDQSRTNPNGTGFRDASFVLTSGVRLYGGFLACGGTWEQRDPNTYETILTGDLLGNDDPDIQVVDLLDDPSRADNSYHVVIVDHTDEQAILDGFTITGGNANGDSWGGNQSGGGICGGEHSGRPCISNCVIAGNAARFGGGLWRCDGLITNCMISKNSAKCGAGLYYCQGAISYSTISYNSASENGGAFYNCHGSVQHCMINKNSAGNHGGGLFHCEGSIVGCTISGNTARFDGGGLAYCDGQISDCTISGNTAQYSGGGLRGCDAQITDCIVADNYGDGLANCNGPISGCTVTENHGRGLYYCDGSISYSIISANSGGGLFRCDGSIGHCVISDNVTTNSGGALYRCHGPINYCSISANIAGEDGGALWECDGPISLCTITANTTGRNGGGLCRCAGPIGNCLIAGNGAGEDGGALWECDGSISLCTITSNTTGGNGAALSGCDGLISNCLIWGNRYDIDSPLHECTNPIFSCVQGGSAGIGCIDVDPQFIDSGHWILSGNPQGIWVVGDYHVSPGSPCIDAGNFFYSMQLPSTDANGNNRMVGSQIDMGCFEFGALVDSDGDWLVDIAEPADANNPDRDDDGIFDGIELLRNTDPNTADPLVQWNVLGDVSSIQEALFFSRSGETIVVSAGVYHENLFIGGRNIMLTGMDPNDPAIVAATIINGDTDRDPLTTSGRVVTMLGSEDETCNIRGLTITGGNTHESGGGIHGHYSDARISRCNISGNTAGKDGGGIWGSGLVSNCTITGNRAQGNGGGIAYSGPIKNCTVAGNFAGGNGGGLAYCHTLTSSCIIWANRQTFDSQLYLYHNLIFSCVNGASGDAGCIDADPQFTNPGHWDANSTPDDTGDDFWVDGDYHLKSEGWRWDTQRKRWDYDSWTSPCIDAGDPVAPLGDEPLNVPEDPGNTYGRNLRINMGVYGGTAQASIPPHNWAIRSDYSNDGTVNFSDFACWTYSLKPGTIISGDLDRNGIADPDDLSILAGDWLKQASWFSGSLSMEPLPKPSSGGTGR